MNNFCVKRKYQKRRIVKNENLIHGYLQKFFRRLKSPEESNGLRVLTLVMYNTFGFLSFFLNSLLSNQTAGGNVELCYSLGLINTADPQ